MKGGRRRGNRGKEKCHQKGVSPAWAADGGGEGGVVVGEGGAH